MSALNAAVETAQITAEWLRQSPIVLLVSAGRVRKANIADAIRISERRFRARVREVLDARPDLDALYEPTAKEVPMALAEQLVFELFDRHPCVHVEFQWLNQI